MIRICRRFDRRPVQPVVRPRGGFAAGGLRAGVLLPLVLGTLGVSLSLSASAEQHARAEATTPTVIPARVASAKSVAAVQKPLRQAHRLRSLKSLPTRPAAATPAVIAATHGATSPYARATAERAESGLPPPGHPQVQHRQVPPTPKPAQ